jgi:uncharacterized membrane protein
MKRALTLTFSIVLLIFAAAIPIRAKAQDSSPNSNPQDMALITTYPSRIIGIGESVTLHLTLKPGTTLDTVQLKMEQIPEGWTATFRGEGQIVTSVELVPGTDATADLRLDPPANVQSGDYHFVVLAQGNSSKAELPIDLTVKEKLPPRLSLSAQLPTIQGSPTTTFRYSVTLKNEGDEDLNVNLTADAPSNLLVKFDYLSQEVTTLPLSANQSASISVSAQPAGDLSAGTYPITINAQGGDASASLDLTAEVTGQSQLTVTAPDGRLSGQIYSGRDTPIKVDLVNNGTSSARGIQLSSSAPTGWTVKFDPAQIDEIPAGQQVEVTAHIVPADKAIAGDYVVTVSAKPADGASKSADFRITVLTSTLWGIVGIALIAIAVGVVAIAVVRFGRR